jgi:hypothetical protein
MVDKLVEESVLTLKDRLYLTGKTEKGGHSHDHSFSVRAPYLYPLYKIHKLNKEQIEAKVKPPNRMVTSAVSGPTYRLGVFLDYVLKPVAAEYCQGELVKDSTDFLNRTADLSDKEFFSDPKLNLAAMDICALYPNIKIDLALVAVRHALETASQHGSKEIDTIIMLLNYTLRHSVVHYRGFWYLSLQGAPTGNPEVPSVANIHVKYVCDERIFVDLRVTPWNKLQHRCRFLDDIWGGWMDTVDVFRTFLKIVNEIGLELGVTFTGECGKSVEFLDVTTSISDGHLKTTMYVKPTDSTRYLNRKSYHSKHTFTGMPYSQFRRAAVICSDVLDREACIQRMEDKFVNSGYDRTQLLAARNKAMSLDRSALLHPETQDTAENLKVLACVINQDPGLKKELNAFFKSHESELKQLLGNVRLVVSERRHTNIAAMLFQKAGFSQTVMPFKKNQKCGSGRCLTSKTMNLGKTIKVNGFTVKLDFRYDCSSPTVIYIAVCKFCDDPLILTCFYLGQTVNSLMSRCNGHRQCFKLSKMDESALSMHVYDKHPEYFQDKLLCFDFGVVKHVNPIQLDRVEDYYIFMTEADTKGLNRYKVTK